MLAALSTPLLFLNNILVVSFTYKMKPMHKAQIYIKNVGLSPLLHVSARLCHPQEFNISN